MLDLARAARRLAAHAPVHSAGGARRLPSLWLFTDPDRTPDPLAIAARLPRGAGIVHRTFGLPRAEAVAGRLAQIARRRGLVLLIGADAGLAARVSAHGVHLPERRLAEARRLRHRRPRWIVTGAAHSARALGQASAVGLDAAFVSPVFPSRSPSAAEPLGTIRLARLIRGVRLPVYALGGVSGGTVGLLRGTGAAGLAAVGALAYPAP